MMFPIMLAFAPALHSEELLRLTPGTARSVVVDAAEDGNFVSIIGNPQIADVTFGPKNTFWFIGLTEGTTNIIVLDTKSGKEMYNAVIKVRDPNLVRVYNKSLITSHTVYRCDPLCVYLKEVTAEEPTALPRGHSQASNASTIQSTTSGTVSNQSGSETIRTTISGTTTIPTLSPP
jgi:hypothetical protein